MRQIGRGGILRSVAVLALVGIGALIWNTLQNIRAVPKLNLLLRDAFVVQMIDPTASIDPDAPAPPVTDPDAPAYVFGPQDRVSEGEWQGCADFAVMSAADLDALPPGPPAAAADIGWQSPVDVALFVRSGLFGRILAAEASIAVRGTDAVLAEVLDPATGSLTAAALGRLPEAPGEQDSRAYRRLAGKLRFAMVQELGCPGFKVFQIRLQPD